MGYRIEYQGRTEEQRTYSFRRGSLFLFWLLTFTVLVCTFWSEGRALLQQALIPGEPEITVHAASELIRQLRAGKNIGDAVTVFCRNIIEYAS